jgi:hypothetical protein
MNPENADLLSQLRDIHGAPGVPWWPPAPGWWLLAALLLVLALYLLNRGRKAWLRRLRRRRGLGWVADVERDIDPAAAPQAFVAAINRIFKVVALSAFPDRNCARLQGAEWTGFLQQELADDPDASQLSVLAAGPYQPAPRFDADALGRLARAWIMRHG